MKWFNPRTGGALLYGSTKRVRGPGLTWTGYAPENREQDWVVLVRRIEETAPPMQFPGAEWTRAEPMDLGLEPAGFNHALNYWRMSVGENGMDELVVVSEASLNLPK